MSNPFDIREFGASHNLSVRGQGYLEAFMKIAEGRRLVEAGTLELQALEGTPGNGNGGSNVTSNVLELTHGPIDVEVLKGYLKDGPLGSGELAIRMGRNPDTVRRALLLDREVRRIGVGGASKWELREDTSTKTLPQTIAAKMRSTRSRAGNFGKDTAHCKKVLEAVQENPWLTTSAIGKKVTGRHDVAVRVTDMLRDAGMMWKAEKTGNPNYKGARLETPRHYWVADPHAKIDIVNVHVKRMHVRDPEALFPAVVEAIRAGKGWAGWLFLKEHTGLSSNPLTRVTGAMLDAGLIRTVEKSGNPAHHLSKNFNQAYKYWELVNA